MMSITKKDVVALRGLCRGRHEALVTRVLGEILNAERDRGMLRRVLSDVLAAWKSEGGGFPEEHELLYREGLAALEELTNDDR